MNFVCVWYINTCGNELDSLRWFSQPLSRTQVSCACCVRCDVLSARMALFTFCVMCRDSANATFWGLCTHAEGYDLQNWTLARFLYDAPTPKVSSSYVYSFGSYRVEKHTNKKIPVKKSNVRCYATTLGNKSWNDSKIATHFVHIFESWLPSALCVMIGWQGASAAKSWQYTVWW